MDELGIRQIFARSPQAKGRVERAAGTFQDRLVTELRLAGATTIVEANMVLDGFILRFNEKFGVQAEQDHPAYRSAEQSASLERILCFKHRRKVSRDNTVRYKQHTLQLLPEESRPTYAGVQVEVQEDLGGRITVQHSGEIIPTQEAPPRPAQLRKTAASPLESSAAAPAINGSKSPWDPNLATLETGEMDRDLRPRKPRGKQHLVPTPEVRALWEDVQQAKLRGLSLRAIAREPGIHRNTVRRYALAENPPLRKKKAQPGSNNPRE